ncbi:hypothetical protein PG993_009134 [Apiospora rasikravindrae]|uniref:F-box domain-containing protein n=1 Tax=Apiospora rasikravindrae TaxID=990691 RepID=A0ABR1SIH6_9PEZI
MAVFSNLPLEIVRCILEFALTPPFGYFRRLLNLRLVNQLFDDEIISSIGRRELLRDESVQCRSVPWHHPNDGAAVSIESGVLFLARYLLDRPHDQSSPWTNLSAFLNHLVDSVLDLHAQPRDDPRRPQMLASLCRHLLNRPGHRAPGIGRFGTDVDVSPGGRPWFLEFLFPASGSLQVQESSKKTLINARVVLGPPWSDGLDGATIISALGP